MGRRGYNHIREHGQPVEDQSVRIAGMQDPDYQTKVFEGFLGGIEAGRAYLEAAGGLDGTGGGVDTTRAALGGLGVSMGEATRIKQAMNPQAMGPYERGGAAA